MKLSDISDPALRARINAKRLEQWGKDTASVPSDSLAVVRPPPKGHGPNKTELQALTFFGLAFGTLLFEGRTFDVVGHSFTPDWANDICCIEVKGPYVFSRDSRILFDAARLAYPELVWIWCRKRTTGRKGRRWEIEIYEAA